MTDDADTESAQPGAKYCSNPGRGTNPKVSSAVVPVAVPVTEPERLRLAGTPSATNPPAALARRPEPPCRVCLGRGDGGWSARALARFEDGWWRTHGLPPQSGTVTADTPPSASPRSAVPAGTTSRCLSQALRLQVVAARAEPEPVDNALGRAAAGLAVGLAAPPRSRRRPARPAAPQPLPPAPNVRPPRPGGQAPTFGVTGLAARPRSPSSGTTPHRPVAVAAVAMAAAPSAPGRRNQPPGGRLRPRVDGTPVIRPMRACRFRRESPASAPRRGRGAFR